MPDCGNNGSTAARCSSHLCICDSLIICSATGLNAGEFIGTCDKHSTSRFLIQLQQYVPTSASNESGYQSVDGGHFNTELRCSRVSVVWPKLKHTHMQISDFGCTNAAEGTVDQFRTYLFSPDCRCAGAGQGIGRCFAHTLGEAGAQVAVVDVNKSAAESTVEELQKKGIRAIAIEVRLL